MARHGPVTAAWISVFSQIAALATAGFLVIRLRARPQTYSVSKPNMEDAG